MNILSNLNVRFRIDAYEAPAREADITTLETFSSITIPNDYREIVREMTEVEIHLGEHVYVRIWGPLGCIEMNTAYKVQEYIPSSLAVGDDEGGNMLVLMNGEK